MGTDSTVFQRISYERRVITEVRPLLHDNANLVAEIIKSMARSVSDLSTQNTEKKNNLT